MSTAAELLVLVFVLRCAAPSLAHRDDLTTLHVNVQPQDAKEVRLMIIIVTPLSLSETNRIQNARTTGRQREVDTERNRNHTERNRNHRG
jgi:hypothetical protein